MHAAFLPDTYDDADAATDVCAAMRAGGIDVWFHQNKLHGGDVWDTTIRRQTPFPPDVGHYGAPGHQK